VVEIWGEELRVAVGEDGIADPSSATEDLTPVLSRWEGEEINFSVMAGRSGS
jgi:hypothetical protein